MRPVRFRVRNGPKLTSDLPRRIKLSSRWKWPEMSDKPNFEDMLGQALDVIDRDLAQQEVALQDRLLQAAQNFVRYCVLEVRSGPGSEEAVPGKFMDYMGSDWFKIIYARTVTWYDARYGAAMNVEFGRTLAGCVLVLDTPFSVRVPMVTREPGMTGETVWLCYHDRVEDNEDALAWIEAGPNMISLPRKDGMKARRFANEVCGNLRAIYIALCTVKAPDSRVTELRDAILPHLEKAAILIVKSGPGNLKHAQWDLQMACELALKLLAQQRERTFPESHDLFHLYDQLPPGRQPFERSRLSCIPNWKQMAEWRYGGGSLISVAEAFTRYRSALRIIQGATSAADRQLYLGRAKLEIRRAPFLHDDPTMFLPRRKSPTEPLS